MVRQTGRITERADLLSDPRIRSMQAISERDTFIAGEVKLRRLDFLFSLTTACPVFAFAFWTVASHLAVAAHFSFQTLVRIGTPATVAGLACGIFAAGASASGWERNGRPANSAPLSDWKWLAVAVALVLVRALGVGYNAFWIASLVFLVWGTTTVDRGHIHLDEKPVPFTFRRGIMLLLLAVASAALTYAVHRPDSDDSVYVGTAADALAHPELPVLSHDVLYGDYKRAPMLPSYRVETYELLIGFLARMVGREPILWAHAIVPTLLAAFLPFAWAALMRTVVPRHWLAATALALLILSMPGDPRALGNFAFVRLFQGKAVLMSIGIPLLYAFAWKYEETGSIWNWFLLVASTVACVGLSSSAIFVAPVALGTAALAGWRRAALTKRMALTLLPAAYPLACGLIVGRGFRALEGVFAYLHPTAPWAVTTVFSPHWQYIFLLALLAAPFVVRESSLRRKLMVVVLIYFLVPLNPFAYKLLSKLTTREAVWRILWSVPVAAIAAVVIVNGLEIASEYWGNRGTIVAGFVLACGFLYLAPYSSFRQSNEVSYSLTPLKVRLHDWEVARRAVAVAPPGGAILAPEEVAIWIPTFVHRPPLVSVRAIYDQQMGVQMPPQEARERRQLRELVSGGEFSAQPAEALLAALSRYDVGLIVVAVAAAGRLEQPLAKYRYSPIVEEDRYVLFARVAHLS
jgi:Family of unknown function (DUF6077)